MTKKAKDIMSTAIFSVFPGMKLSDITKMMMKEGIHGVYVFDPEKRITGTIDDTNIIKIFGKKLVEKVKAKDVMSKVDVKISPEAPIEEVVNLMRQKRKRKLYVFYQETDLFTVGVISIKDIIRVVDKEKTAIEMTRFLSKYIEFQDWLLKLESSVEGKQ